MEQIQALGGAARDVEKEAAVTETTSEAWSRGWFKGLTQDLRYGFRLLKKSPTLSSVSILTLLLGIGASTAIFSVVYGVLLRPLPYDKPEQIVRMWELDAKTRRMQFSDPNFEDLRAQAQSLQAIAQLRSGEAPITIGNAPDRVRVAHVSADFFSVMGIKPVVGRLFVAEEQKIGASPTALLSYSYWQSHLNKTPDLAAVNLTVSKEPAVIIGVLPPGFHFPDDTQVWMPRELEPRLPSRSAHNWQVVARTRDGVSVEQARADVSAIGRRISQENRLAEKSLADTAMLPLKDALTMNVRPALLILLGVAGLLLLVACANVMNLSLAQASARADELAIRVALGASRWRLVRQFVTEALIVCLLGGLLGVLAAYFGVRALLAFAPPDIPRLDQVSVNLSVLLFALALSFVVAAALGVITALRATSGQVRSALAEAGRRQGVGARSRRTGRLIVAGQIAITLTLLTGAGLLGRSMLHVLSINPGFQTEHIVTLELKLGDLEARSETQRVQFLERLISDLQALPGVQTVGGTNVLPLKNSDSADGMFAVLNAPQLTPEQRELIERSAHVSGADPDPAFMKDLTKFFDELFRNKAQTENADFAIASEGYFQTLGIPLLKGRMFTASDGPDAPHVALISESVARQKWPNEDPIGRTIEFGNMDADLRLLTIIGVVGEVRKHNLEAAPHPTVYVNYRQRSRSADEFDVVLRTNSDPEAMFPAVRRVLTQLDATVPAKIGTLNQTFSASLNNRRFNLLLVGVFALTALLLAMAGVFGVLAYSVVQRTQEIGVRIALGATTGNVLKMILTQVLITTTVGIAAGIVGALALTRTMRSLLFEVSPNDPVTIIGIALLLMLVAILASYIPARRATRINPMIALRNE